MYVTPGLEEVSLTQMTNEAPLKEINCVKYSKYAWYDNWLQKTKTNMFHKFSPCVSKSLFGNAARDSIPLVIFSCILLVTSTL